jgi:hypothetical protein
MANKQRKVLSPSRNGTFKIRVRRHCTSIRRAEIPNAVRDVESQELPFIADENFPLEDNLAVSYKTKYTFTIASSEQASWYFSK